MNCKYKTLDVYTFNNKIVELIFTITTLLTLRIDPFSFSKKKKKPRAHFQNVCVQMAHDNEFS